MNSVQIFEIELQDYRQYQGTVTVPLKASSDEHINVIEGGNGAGKSNLLNAITLCFYNKEIHLDTKGKQGLASDPYVNLKRLDELDVGETAEGYVEVTLGTEQPKYLFKRTFETAKLGEDEYESTSHELKLFQRFGQDWKEVQHPHTQLSQILPTRVHEYFFFDGEQLDEFFEDGYPDRVESAILDISHVELLNRAIKHLDDVQTDYEDKSGELGGEVEEKKNAYHEVKAEVEDLKEQKAELEEEIDKTDDQIQEIDEQLSRSPSEEVRRKQEERDDLNEELQSKKDKLKQETASAGEALATAGMVVYNKDALEYTDQRFEEMEDSGELPPKIQRWFVENLLERERCICGEELDEQHKREHLEQLKNEVTDVTGNEIEGKIEVSNIIDRVEDHVDTLVDRKGTVDDIEDEIDRIDAKLKNISSELETKDIDEDFDPAALEAQRQRLENQKEDMIDQRGQLKAKIASKEEKRDELHKEWQNEVDKQDKRRELLTKVNFVAEAKETVKDIKSDILEQVRSQTEESLEEYYNELIWKDEDYDIELTSDYEVKLHGPSNEKHLGTLAAGERQVLALSFMSALSQISGYSAPLVIDTPLGRLSKENKQRVAQNVPGYLEGTQVTFLMTDTEYQDVDVFFQKYLANEYYLDYHDEVTEVTPQ
jgi:DNA sulfur modification protein DndD